jgi:hypothetical protein
MPSCFVRNCDLTMAEIESWLSSIFVCLANSSFSGEKAIWSSRVSCSEKSLALRCAS